jgi:hypothetical protein
VQTFSHYTRSVNVLEYSVRSIDYITTNPNLLDGRDFELESV